MRAARSKAHPKLADFCSAPLAGFYAAVDKTAPAVQAVIAQEQRQMEMDFGGQVVDAEAAIVVDEAQMRSAVDGLDEMEVMLRVGGGEKLVAR